MVLFSLDKGQVLEVHDGLSMDTLSLFDQHLELQLSVNSQRNFHWSTNFTNNKYARAHVKKSLKAIVNARNGGPIQAMKRLIHGMPVYCQNLSESPYLDHDLFSFDERVVNSSDKIRVCPEQVIQFFDRQTGRQRIRIDPHEQSDSFLWKQR
jgi:de-etiolated-1